MGAFLACIQCGRCTGACPESGITPLNIRLLMRMRQLGLPIGGSVPWLCTCCGTCTLRCPRDVRPGDELVRIRSGLVEQGDVPASVQKALEHTFVHRNPFGRSRSRRALWVEALPFRVPHVKDTEERRLLFSCCIHAYDERCMKIPTAFATVLAKAQVEFGILYEEETCCGNEVERLGELGLFEELMEELRKTIGKYGVREIICLSPHCMNAFKVHYGLPIPIYHYSQVLARLFDEGLLKAEKGLTAPCCYHDPCFLGKQNRVFEEPRRVLRMVSSELIEFSRSREISLCCEGGGGRMFYDPDFVYERRAEKRILEAETLKGGRIATACPFCLRMLGDAAIEKGIDVVDITEIVLEVL